MNREEIQNERNSIKIRMQSKSEAIKNLYGGWK